MTELTEEEIEKKQQRKADERRRIAEIVFEIARDDDFEYGISNAARVLAGSTGETLDQNNLQEHSLYGELSEYPHQELKTFIKKLADHKLLNRRKVGNYAYVLKFTNKAREILEEDKELPLIVLPRTNEEYQEVNKSSDEISYDMKQDGMSPAEIAEKRDLQESTIYSHLETFVESGELDAGELVDEETMDTICEHLESDAVDLSGEVYLSNIKDALSDDITYDEISIVLTDYRNNL